MAHNTLRLTVASCFALPPPIASPLAVIINRITTNYINLMNEENSDLVNRKKQLVQLKLKGDYEI